MPISFSCPHCGHETQVANQYAGQSGNCSACGESITIPAAPIYPAESFTPSSSSNSKILIIVCLVVAGFACLCGLILFGLLLPAVGGAREAANRMGTLSNMKQIGIAFHDYHARYHSFPGSSITNKNGLPMHSWRVAILSDLGHPELFEQYDFNKPWNDPENLRIEDKMPVFYRCQSVSNLPRYHTTFMVVVGPTTPFGPNRFSSMADIIDGTTNTIMVVEGNKSVHWMEPSDLDMAQMTYRFGASDEDLADHHSQGSVVLMMDAAVETLDANFEPGLLKGLLQHRDGVLFEERQLRLRSLEE